MRALPEGAVAGFTDALLAERFPFLDTEQRSSTAQFVLERWGAATQPVHLGIGAVATVLGGVAWFVATARGSDREHAWAAVVSRCSRRDVPLVSELTLFVLSLATAYASERWPAAAADAGRLAPPRR